MKEYKATVIKSKTATDIYIRTDKEIAESLMKQAKDLYPNAKIETEGFEKEPF